VGVLDIEINTVQLEEALSTKRKGWGHLSFHSHGQVSDHLAVVRLF
jgi:hypothetical protein